MKDAINFSERSGQTRDIRVKDIVPNRDGESRSTLITINGVAEILVVTRNSDHDFTVCLYDSTPQGEPIGNPFLKLESLTTESEIMEPIEYIRRTMNG